MDTNPNAEPQETSPEVTPAQDTNETPEVNQPKTVTIEIPENYEYNGDRTSVPKPFENYAKSFDRYVSKKDQVIADLNKKAQELETKLSEFNQSKSTNPGTVEPQQPLVTQDEIDAIALGDARVLENVIERKAKQLLETNVVPKIEEVKKEQSALLLHRKELEAAETIKTFSDVNPDFKSLLASPVGEFMVDAARRGLDIETIYKSAKAAEQYFFEKAESRRKEEIEKKRNGSVVGKTMSGTPDVLYAEDENSAKRLAIELAMKGDKREVHVKHKKK